MFIDIDKKYSSDSSIDVWKNYYTRFYGSMDWDFWKIFDYEELKRENGRLYAGCRKDLDSKYNHLKVCKLGGEMDFNFNSSRTWQKAKYEYYKNLLKGDAVAIELLESCKERQYKCCNLSVVITTGGLNNLKGRASQDIRSLDRFDVFIFILNDYFNKRNRRNNKKEDFMHIIFSEAWHNSKENRKCLYEYLSLFTDINDYFQKNYAIDDRDLVKDLIVSGSKSIDSKTRAIEYLNLAQRYWSKKENKILEVVKGTLPA